MLTAEGRRSLAVGTMATAAALRGVVRSTCSQRGICCPIWSRPPTWTRPTACRRIPLRLGSTRLLFILSRYRLFFSTSDEHQRDKGKIPGFLHRSFLRMVRVKQPARPTRGTIGIVSFFVETSGFLPAMFGRWTRSKNRLVVRSADLSLPQKRVPG